MQGLDTDEALATFWQDPSGCSEAGYRANVARMRSGKPCGHPAFSPIFRLAPFHADKISLKRGLKKRPARGCNGFD